MTTNFAEANRPNYYDNVFWKLAGALPLIGLQVSARATKSFKERYKLSYTSDRYKKLAKLNSQYTITYFISATSLLALSIIPK